MTTPRRRVPRRARAIAALVLAAGLAACGGDSDDAAPTGTTVNAAAPDEGGTADGPWEFTDDRGTKITLPSRPKRIVAQVHAAAALWDFGVRPVGVFGPQELADGTKDPQAGNVDLSAVESVGAAFGEFNLEQFSALKPDLVVTIIYGPVLWYVPEDAQPRIEEVAPVVGIQLAGTSVADGIERFGELAAALGADLDADEVRDARQRFEAASEQVREAAKAKPGLKVGVVIGDEEAYWVATSAFHGDVKYFADLGLDIMEPANPDPAFGFEKLSWEQADRYQADLLLEDARKVGLTPEELAAKYATWRSLPAVQARQVGAWQAETPFSYKTYARVLERLAETVRTARTDVVP